MAVLQKEVGFLADVVGNVINSQKAKGPFVMVDHCSVVPEVAIIRSGRGLDSESVVRVALGRNVTGSELEDKVLERLVTNQTAVEVPVSVFKMLGSHVVMEFYVVV